MTDPVNSIFTNNINLIVFLLVVFITFWLKSNIGKLVDSFLTMKNLKATLFIVLMMMVFLVSNTVYNFIPIDAILVAPYMIAMSALLASIVAVINIVNNNVKNIIDKYEKVIALTHSGIARISFFTEKSKFLKLMLMGESKILYDSLIEFEIMLRDILNFLNRDDWHRFSNHSIFYEVHNDLVIFLPILKKVIRDIDKDPEKYSGKYIKIYENSEYYEKFIENLDKLIIVLEEVRIAETKEYKKLYDEQQER